MSRGLSGGGTLLRGCLRSRDRGSIFDLSVSFRVLARCGCEMTLQRADHAPQRFGRSNQERVVNAPFCLSCCRLLPLLLPGHPSTSIGPVALASSFSKSWATWLRRIFEDQFR